MIEIKKTKIDPIGCYKQAYEFVKDDYMNWWAIVFVGLMVAGFFPLILQGPITCGLAMCCLTKMRGGRPDLSLCFKGFDYFKQGIVAMALSIAVTIVLILPAIFFMFAGMITFTIGGENEQPLMIGIGILCFALYIVTIIFLNMAISMITYFSCALIVDRQVDGLAAFKAGISGYYQNLFGMLGHAVVGGAIAFVFGLFCCGLPMIALVPVMFVSNHMAYVKIFGEGKSGSVPPVQNVAAN